MPTIQPASSKGSLGSMFTRLPARTIAVAQTNTGSEQARSQPDVSRRLVVELRDMPAELIPKRLSKALLAQHLRPATHIQGDAHEHGGGRRRRSEWRNPSRSSHHRRCRSSSTRKTAMTATRKALVR